MLYSWAPEHICVTIFWVAHIAHFGNDMYGPNPLVLVFKQNAQDMVVHAVWLVRSAAPAIACFPGREQFGAPANPGKMASKNMHADGTEYVLIENKSIPMSNQ